MTTKIPSRHRSAGHRKASASITVDLAALDFPARTDHIVEKVGARRVEIAEGVDMLLGEMLRMVGRDEFGSISQVQDALDAHWQDFRALHGEQDPPPPRMTEPGG